MDRVETRILQSSGDGTTALIAELPRTEPAQGWVWADVLVGPGDLDRLESLTAGLRLDPMALHDAVDDVDLSKVDDFGHHLLVILHGLRSDRIGTYELDCFVTARHLVTVHQQPSPAVDALWAQLQSNPLQAAGGVDELLGLLADVLTRRLLSVADAFDNRIDELIERALVADPEFLSELTAVRIDLAAVRRVVHPQRETLDLLRRSPSPLLGTAGRRRLSDVFDVAVRAAHELDAARTALAETLEAYRGAEARQATNVTKILTVYAAIMLPLSLIAGIFGMNFANLPGLRSETGWVVVLAAMLVIAVVSLAVFAALGWIRRPVARRPAAGLGVGLLEAARSPAVVRASPRPDAEAAEATRLGGERPSPR